MDNPSGSPKSARAGKRRLKRTSLSWPSSVTAPICAENLKRTTSRLMKRPVRELFRWKWRLLKCGWMRFSRCPEVQAAEEDPIEQTIEKEMKVFKNKCKDYADKGKKRSDTLDCWKKFEPRAPNLARAARVLLAVPVTSAACERDFSASKALYTPQRRSMSQETLENFTMIRRRSKVPSNEQKRKRAQTKPGGNL